MVDSKEFAVSVFDALARRRRQKLEKITKDELRDFWLQISDQSFDARLQIFFDMYVSLILYLFFGFVFTFITVTGITQCNLQKHKKTNVLSQGGTNINY